MTKPAVPHLVTPRPRAPEFEVLDIDVDHVKGVAFNMLFAVWRFHTHYEPYRRCLHWSDQLAKRHPEGIGVMHIVEATAIPPDAPTRRLFSDAVRHSAVRHYSVVHTARGFKAASIRAVVAGSFALARPSAAHSVHSNINEAAAWHALQQRRLGRDESTEQIARVAEGLRRLHAERHPGAPQASP
jgi:hypothetical protein